MTTRKSVVTGIVAIILLWALPIQGQTFIPVPSPPAVPAPQIVVPTRSLDLGYTVRYASPYNSNGGIALSWYGGNPNSPLVDFLAAQHIQQQVEMSDDQKTLYKDLQKKLSQEYTNITNKYPQLKDKNLSNEERRKLNQTVSLKYQEFKKELSKELEDSLVPQQLQLIEKVKFNQSVQMYGLTWTLTNGHFKDKAEITKDQKAELEKIKMDSEKAIQEKIEQMREDAKAKMLKVLNSKQKNHLKEWEGDAKKKQPIRL